MRRCLGPIDLILLGIGGIVGAGIFALEEMADLSDIGTLSAFVIVCIGVIVLPSREPNRCRPFRAPWVPWLPGLGGVGLPVLDARAASGGVDPLRRVALRRARLLCRLWLSEQPLASGRKGVIFPATSDAAKRSQFHRRGLDNNHVRWHAG